MIGTALKLRHAMTKIACNGSDTPARQIGQQTDRNFMGANDFERMIQESDSVVSI